MVLREITNLVSNRNLVINPIFYEIHWLIFNAPPINEILNIENVFLNSDKNEIIHIKFPLDGNKEKYKTITVSGDITISEFFRIIFEFYNNNRIANLGQLLMFVNVYQTPSSLFLYLEYI